WKERVFSRDNEVSELVSPAFGTELDSTETFTWNLPSGGSSVWLCVGVSEAAPCNYYSSAVTGTSATVTTIPQDDKTVYVSIWDKIGPSTYSTEAVQHTFRTE
ncbi:MAG: hypothetical protein K8I00_05390, partial [Candidatus Omnitrophica bacterium]|nr:hypothetical protein [Candidatus Omnitrophota bacterium]